jgi:hypothetical protein
MRAIAGYIVEYRNALEWLTGWQRTVKPSQNLNPSSAASEQKSLEQAIAKIGGNSLAISTNKVNEKEPSDAGVAVKFAINGQRMVIACDKWNRVADNMRAIIRTIAALEQIKWVGGERLWSRILTAFKV